MDKKADNACAIDEERTQIGSGLTIFRFNEKKMELRDLAKFLIFLSLFGPQL